MILFKPPAHALLSKWLSAPPRIIFVTEASMT